MIAGVWDPEGAHAALSWLGRLGSPFVEEAPVVWADSNAAVAAWPGLSQTGLNPARGCAFVGKPLWADSGVDEPDLERVARTRGDFGLILICGDGLLVARGRWPGRAMFYRATEGKLFVCSRLAPLLEAGSVSLDVERLAWLMGSEPPHDLSRTVYSGVSRVLAGEVLNFRGGRLARRTIGRPCLFDERGEPARLASDLRDRMGQAVRRSASGARRVAVSVSGGLDSSAVLMHLVGESRRPDTPEIDAVNLSFEDQGDDRPYFSLVSREAGTDVLCLSPADTGRWLLPSLVADAAPMPWPTAAWETALAMRARERGAGLLLTGVGGDDLFTGNPSVLASPGLCGRLIGAWRAYHLRAYWNPQPLRLAYEVALKPILARSLPASLRCRRQRGLADRRWPWARGAFRRVLHVHADAKVERALSRRADDHPLLEDLRTHLLDMADMRNQVECASGVRRCDPLLDDDIVEFAASIPPQSLLIGGDVRGLFRAALLGVVPDRVRLRPDKSDFDAALETMIRPYSRELDDLARGDSLADLGMIEPVIFREQCRRMLAGDTAPGWLTVWPALAVEAFLRAFRSGSLRRSPAEGLLREAE